MASSTVTQTTHSPKTNPNDNPLPNPSITTRPRQPLRRLSLVDGHLFESTDETAHLFANKDKGKKRAVSPSPTLSRPPSQTNTGSTADENESPSRAYIRSFVNAFTSRKDKDRGVEAGDPSCLYELRDISASSSSGRRSVTLTPDTGTPPVPSEPAVPGSVYLRKSASSPDPESARLLRRGLQGSSTPSPERSRSLRYAEGGSLGKLRHVTREGREGIVAAYYSLSSGIARVASRRRQAECADDASKSSTREGAEATTNNNPKKSKRSKTTKKDTKDNGTEQSKDDSDNEDTSSSKTSQATPDQAETTSQTSSTSTKFQTLKPPIPLVVRHRTPIPYTTAEVLMLRWSENESSPVPEPMQRLADVFRTGYFYTVTHCPLPRADARRVLAGALAKLVHGKGPNHLIVLYYAGPASTDEQSFAIHPPRALFRASPNPRIDLKDIFETHLCSPDVPSDVLLLLDAPFSCAAPAIPREGKEIFAATPSARGFPDNSSYSPGQSVSTFQFTNALCKELEDAKWGWSFWTVALEERLRCEAMPTRWRPWPPLRREPVLRVGCGPVRRYIHLGPTEG